MSEKRKARDAVRRAVQRGDLIKPDHCQRCKRRGPVQAHHTDYTKPLEIEWLCFQGAGSCHPIADGQVAVARMQEAL